MRIVMDARHARDFGIGTYIRGLLQGLAEVDASNRYVIVLPAGEEVQLPALPGNFETVTYSGTDLDYFDHVAFPAFLRRLKPDLCHITLNRVPWFMPQPYVVTVHDMSRQLLAGTGWRTQASLYRARRGLVRARRVISVSQATLRSVQSALDVPVGHFRVVPNAPDPRFLMRPPDADQERLRQLERFQINYPFVLYAGHIRAQKNVPRLIEAFAVLRTELADDPRYQDLRLVILGADINQHPEVRRAATQCRQAAAIRFLGFVPFETLRAFYESAEVFAFPSLYEGFGLAPLEAMACGTPVVTSNCSSLPEVVGDAAVQVNPDNVFDIARGLREVLQDSALRQRLVESGTRQAARFSWPRTAAAVLDVYREAVASP
ncbi:MAG: glycosyltransferase family 4 protein [Bryobacterales bacterium]|nr:glycosyltransferase family 4 protein [Bryobacterales bacterium]